MKKIKEVFSLPWLKNQYVTIIQLIVSIVFLGMLLIEMPVLPFLYIMVVIVGLLLLLLLSYTLQYNKAAFSLRGIISKILSVIVSMALVFGCFVNHSGSSFMNSFTGNTIQTDAMSVIVLNSRDFDDINDLKNKTLMYNNSIDEVNIESAKKDIQSQIECQFTETDHWDTLNQELMSEKVDAIVVNEAYRVLLENVNDNFSDDTKVIYQIEIKSKAKNIANKGAVKDGTFHVLISGIDTYGSISTRSRSDVNMIMTVNMKTHKILLTGIPRDCYVPLAMNGQYDKLTHSGIYGINETVQTLENFLDIDIDYYYRVNFSSVVNVVDVLGGIDVYSDRALTLDGMTYQQGMNHMDGEKALRYARERHSYGEGDYHRIQNQQEVLIGIINKIISTDTIMNYQTILNKVEGTFDTNMSKDDLLTLIRNQIDSMKGFSIERQYLYGNGKMTYGLYSMPNSKLYTLVPNETSRSEISNKIKEAINS